MSLMQRTFIFDGQTKEIIIYRTVGWKKVILDGSKKKYNLSLRRIFLGSSLGSGTLLVLVLQENGKSVYKIAEALSKRRLISLAERIQGTIGCSFLDESDHTVHDSNIEELR